MKWQADGALAPLNSMSLCSIKSQAADVGSSSLLTILLFH
jgi:hypothetical protein